jgi:hypothetical protein
VFKLIFSFVIMVAGIVLLIYVVDPYQIYKETAFKSFYENLEKSIEKLDCVNVYNYKSDEYKNRVRFDYYVLNCEGNKTTFIEEVEIHNLWVVGDTGYADTTRTSCISADCTGEGKLENREVKRYLFIKGKWTIPDNDQPLELVNSN